MTACEQNQKNRDNLRYCKERGIRLSGPRLGRPPKVKDPNAQTRIPRCERTKRGGRETGRRNATLWIGSYNGMPSGDK